LKRYLGLDSCFIILSSSYKLRSCTYLLNETFGQLLAFVGFLVDDRGTEGHRGLFLELVSEAQLEVVAIVIAILALVDIDVLELTIKLETLSKLWQF
jgi:hypothetical protein